ncbi:MAG: glucose 1-dehydrogenase [Actinocatenispora sp.]
MQAMTVVPGKPDTAAVGERADPDTGDGSVLVAGVAIGICGTDREIVHRGHGRTPPGHRDLVLGHESLGRVLSAPTGSGLDAGDLVVGVVRRPDDCPCCQAGEWDFCRTGNYTERGIKGADGFGSRQWRADPGFLIRLAPTLADTGVLLEPTSVVAKAWEQIDIIRGRACHDGNTALITGAGPIGLLAALLAVQRGYDTHVYDLMATGPKPDLVTRLGATYHSGAARDLPVRPDAVVEATGVGELVFDVLELTAPNAVICLTGISTGSHDLAVPADAVNRRLVMGNEVIVGSVNAARRHYEQAASALAAADPDWLLRMISRRVPLAHWPDALTRQDSDVKVVVDLEH